jgi:hypothetical protein
MQKYDFAAMSVDTLWQLREEMRVVLAAKLAEQQEINDRPGDVQTFRAVPPVTGRRRADAR